MSVPDGYEPFSPSPFGELVGPLYAGRRDAGPTIAVRVGAEHANRNGRAHGGLMMTVADIALTRAARERLPPNAGVATADLHIAFLESVVALQNRYELEAEEILDLGKGVGFRVLIQKGRPVGSSGEVQLRYAAVGVWDDGKIARLTNYIDEARAAAERLAQERG